LSYSDFNAECQQFNGAETVDLLNYNRLVAHAMLVCSNAAYENIVSPNQMATQHAAMVCEAVQQLSAGLKTRFLNVDDNGQGPLDQVFLNMANTNPLNMLPSTKPDTSLNTNLQAAYIHHSGDDNISNNDTMGSTNIWLDPSIVGDYATNKPNSSGTTSWYGFPLDSSKNAPVPDVSMDTSFPGDAPRYFGLGYSPISCLQGSYNITLCYVPIFPASMPHLISPERFNLDTTPIANAPPNAFKAIDQAGGPLPDTNSKTAPGSKDSSKVNSSNVFLPQGASKTVSQIANEGTSKNLTVHSSGSGSSSLLSKQLKNKSHKPLPVRKNSTFSFDSLYVHAMSAAIVGCGAAVYPAAIPGGFIRIKNMPNMLTAMGQSNSLGPVSYDCSKYITDNDLYSAQIDIATPVPMLADGVTPDLPHVIWIDAQQVSSVEAALQSWIAFNSTPLTSSSSLYWNKDIVNSVQGNPTIDPLYIATGTTASATMQNNPNLPLSKMSASGSAGLHMGTNDLTTRADLQHILQVKGFVSLTDLIMGDPNATGISNNIVAQILAGNSTVQGLAQDLGWKTTPKPDTTFPFSCTNGFPGFDAVLYAKTLVMNGFPNPYQWAEGTTTTTFPSNFVRRQLFRPWLSK
jgi:hypothetical protein